MHELLAYTNIDTLTALTARMRENYALVLDAGQQLQEAAPNAAQYQIQDAYNDAQIVYRARLHRLAETLEYFEAMLTAIANQRAALLGA